MKTEKKVEGVLKKYFANVQVQFKPTWVKNPVSHRHLSFDFCIYHIIIELDGDHHFKTNTREHTDFDQNRHRDIYKMKKAMQYGYSVIRLYQPDVWEDKYNWEEKLIQNIRILLTLPPNILYMTYDNLYDQHMEDYARYDVQHLMKALETYEKYQTPYLCKTCGNYKIDCFYSKDHDICMKCKDDKAFVDLFEKIRLCKRMK